MIREFFEVFLAYLSGIILPLAAGFTVSGAIQEFVPQRWIEERLGGKGFLPILYSSMIGAVIPVCCWGSLPIAVTFHRKGASLGPVFAFLIATPATSLSALFVSWRFLGLFFTAYVFAAVILIALIAGITGRWIKHKRKDSIADGTEIKKDGCCAMKVNRSIKTRITAVFKYAFIKMPRDIGLELLIGMGLAAFVVTFVPVGRLIEVFLSGGSAYIFSVVFGLLVYMCSTASVPLVHAFIGQGMAAGAAMALLIIGPVESYGTILVLKKEFGFRVLLFYLVLVSAGAVAAGFIFSLI